MPIAVNDPRVAYTDESVYVLNEDTGGLLHLDVNRRIWSTRAPFPQGRCPAVSMVSAKDKLFLAGGYDRMCSCYNMALNAWFMLQPPLQTHRYGALVHYDNKLILLGGSFNYGTNEVEEYDIEGDSWSMISHFRMPTKIYGHYALLLDMD